MTSIFNSIPSDEPTVLFIKGVFQEDCTQIDDIFEEQLLQEAFDTEKVIFDNIPIILSSLDEYPESSNIKCWHCDLTFDGRPVLLPDIIEKHKDTYKLSIYAGCCSFACGMAYISLYFPKVTEKFAKIDMLKLLYKLLNGKTPIIMKKAPSRHIMIHYGKEITSISEYRQQVQLLDSSIKFK
jgi:hypothetical protein